MIRNTLAKLTQINTRVECYNTRVECYTEGFWSWVAIDTYLGKLYKNALLFAIRIFCMLESF